MHKIFQFLFKNALKLINKQCLLIYFFASITCSMVCGMEIIENNKIFREYDTKKIRFQIKKFYLNALKQQDKAILKIFDKRVDFYFKNIGHYKKCKIFKTITLKDILPSDLLMNILIYSNTNFSLTRFFG
ncbi:hypothetical protein ACFLYH_01360, partial [Candidatus Dependentiae bacterium]